MTEPLHIELPDAGATEALGAALAACLVRGCIVYLHGNLGAGKTTLVRGLLRGLGHEGAVRSPTYTLVEPYTVADFAIYHYDLYRLGDPEELEYLGLREQCDGRAILLFEWPERGGEWLPAADLVLRLQHAGEGRRAEFITAGARGRSVLDCLRNSL